jgi:hypothetical protein
MACRFPGAQMSFALTDMQSREALTRGPIIGLQGRAKGPPGSS